MTSRSGGNRSRQRRQGNGRSRLLTMVAVIVIILAAVAALPRIFALETGKSSTPPPKQAAAQATPTGTSFVVPTPAIPLPKSCPQDTIPGVDNPGRYGFCIPSGWGAWNENNSSQLTQIIKARFGDSPVLQPTDFDRIQVVVNLNTGSPGDSVPGDCKGDPNDKIDVWGAHHCSAQLNPDNNPYHAARAEFWMVDLTQGRKFYMTAFLAGDTTSDDDAIVSMVAHNVKPPGSQ